MLGPILLTIHNLTYYQRLMQAVREAIEAGRVRRVLRAKMAGCGAWARWQLGQSARGSSRREVSDAAMLLPLLVAAQDLMITRYSIGSRPVRVLPSGRFLFAAGRHER